MTFPRLPNGLKYPRSIFVDSNDNIYVSFENRGYVFLWCNGSDDLSKIYYVDSVVTNPTNTYSIIQSIVDFFSNLWGIFRDSLAVSNSLFVAPDGIIYVVNDHNSRIDRWGPDSKRTGITLDDHGSCYGLFVDINEVLYCSVYKYHKVIKKSLKDSSQPWETVVENGGKSLPFLTPLPKQLEYPYGIFVDDNLDLYVADFGHDRIQLFKGGKSENETSIRVDDTGRSLNGPTNVILDADKKFIYRRLKE